MNTQQKRVKWSRGETADALEERTDTGITNVSAELMENVICDIYGNVSRRPALKLLQSNIDVSSIVGNTSIMCIPFFITDDDFVLIYGRHAVRVVNRVIVARSVLDISALGGSEYVPPDRNASFAQQNNYVILAKQDGVFRLYFNELNDTSFSIKVERFIYSGAWYAPNGTTDYSVSNIEIPGLMFNEDKQGFSQYVYTDGIGNSFVYSLLDTGLTSTQSNALLKKIPIGSIVQMPNLGCSVRVEGFVIGGADGFNLLFPNIIFDGVINYGEPVPSNGIYAKITKTSTSSILPIGNIAVYTNGIRIEATAFFGNNNGVYTNDGFFSANTDGTWKSVPSAKAYVFGGVLAPIVDKSLTDSVVSVTAGYVNLSQNLDTTSALPYPSIVLFKDQRLWTSGYVYQVNELPSGGYKKYSYPGLVVASQIAKYNNFKNNYGYENEAITLDVLTKFKEEVIYLADYNGLKIFTNYAEYDYNGGVVKQSENGALKGCQPLVFGPLLLYADKTGHQIKSMQYELQSDIFASNIVNNLAPKDLVCMPIRLAGEEEKDYYVGRFLYVLNSDETAPVMSVCNFVLDTQNIIWARYSFGWQGSNIMTDFGPILDIVQLKRPIFVVAVNNNQMGLNSEILFAEWDYDSLLDFQTSLEPSDSRYIIQKGTSSPLSFDTTIANASVAVYDGNTYMWDDVTDNNGYLSKSLSSLTNPIVGIPINAKIRSHPIDIGGKTKSIAKRISKSLLSMRNTNAGAITVNKKTGYWNHDNSYVNFYNCTGMKREVKLEIENIHSAKFTIESVLMNIEYGTLVS